MAENTETRAPEAAEAASDAAPKPKLPFGIFTRFTWASLRANRTRTVVSVVGIVLSAALITAVLTTMTSLNHGLLQRAVTEEGNWYVYNSAVSDRTVDALVSNPKSTLVATSRELGSAQLDPDIAKRMNSNWLSLYTMPVVEKGGETDNAALETLMNLPEITEGRLPEKAGEIVLPLKLKGKELVAGVETQAEQYGEGGTRNAETGELIELHEDWTVPGVSGVQSNGPLELGSTITLQLGYLVNPADHDAVLYSNDPEVAGHYDYEADHWVNSEPELRESAERTFTVVGFRAPQPDASSYLICSVDPAVAVVSAAEELPSYGGVARATWATFDGYSSYTDFDTDMRAAFDKRDTSGSSLVRSTDSTIYHYDVLRYSGLLEDRALYDSFYMVAAVLIAVIVIASVSLIYNSFAISVAERTRQFGLLASLGASKRQLRRAVFIEALSLGAVGIPFGIALGIAGVAVTLRLTATTFSYLFETPDAVGLFVEWPVLAGVAGLSVLILLASAAIPAWRAARVPAVQAIRQSGDARIGRSAAWEIRRAERKGQLPVSPKGLPGLAAKVAGVSGFVAHRNLSRASSRGRVISASLAVSFALFVTSGVISLYLRPLQQLAAYNGAQVDADVAVQIMSPEERAQDKVAAVAEQVLDAVEADEQAEVSSTLGTTWARMTLPASMVSDAMRADLVAEVAEEYDVDLAYGTLPADAPAKVRKALDDSMFLDDGSYLAYGVLAFLDDASWAELCEEVGLTEEQAKAPGTVIGLNTYRSNVYNPDGTYRIFEPFAEAGEATVYSETLEHESVDATMVQLVIEDGKLAARKVLSYADDTGEAQTEPMELADAYPVVTPLHVAGYTTSLPDLTFVDGSSGNFPYFLLSEASMGQGLPYADYKTIGITVGDPAHSTELTEYIRDEILGTEPDVSGYVDDLGASVRQMQSLSFTIKLFAGLFSVITMLIALANVFNTLSNSISLRAREFAVLRSVGMGPGAFRRMIVMECASYALRGLVGGMVLAVLIDFGVYRGFGLSFEGLGFELPWGYVAAAAAGVVAVLGVSVLYALHKSHALNIVDALRSEVA